MKILAQLLNYYFIAIILLLLVKVEITQSEENESTPSTSTMSTTSDEKEVVTTLNKHEKLIVLSFDGFRHDYLDRVNAPTLQALKCNGSSTHHMNPQFLTKTFVNHQSFVTGLYAESHGVVDNKLHDPNYDGVIHGYANYDDRFWNFSPDVVPLWILNEWAGDGRISGVQFPGANQHYGPNKSLPTHYLEYDHHRSFESRMDYVYSWLTNKTHPANLIFMYFDEPDSSGHAYGPESTQVNEQILKLDNLTNYLLNKLQAGGILEEVNIMIWSDHGMQEVNIGNRIKLNELVKTRLFERYGSTPSLQIAPYKGFEELVYKAFKWASRSNHFQIYNRSEIPERWHYKNNRRIQEILLVAEPGYVFDDFKPNETNISKKFGVHGYDSQTMSMKPFFIAFGPRFKQNFTAEPFENIDLFPLIARLCGFGVSNYNGSFDRVKELLNLDNDAANVNLSSGKLVSNLGSTFLIGITTAIFGFWKCSLILYNIS